MKLFKRQYEWRHIWRTVVCWAVVESQQYTTKHSMYPSLIPIFCIVFVFNGNFLFGCICIIRLPIHYSCNFVWHDLFIPWSTIATTPQCGFFGFRKIDVKKCCLHRVNICFWIRICLNFGRQWMWCDYDITLTCSTYRLFFFFVFYVKKAITLWSCLDKFLHMAPRRKIKYIC